MERREARPRLGCLRVAPPPDGLFEGRPFAVRTERLSKAPRIGFGYFGPRSRVSAIVPPLAENPYLSWFSNARPRSPSLRSIHFWQGISQRIVKDKGAQYGIVRARQ